MIKDKLASKLSIDVSVTGWAKTFDALDKQGRLDQKLQGQVLQLLCEEVAELQEKPTAILSDSKNSPANFGGASVDISIKKTTLDNTPPKKPKK